MTTLEGRLAKLSSRWLFLSVTAVVFVSRLPFLGPGFGTDTDAWRFIRTAMIWTGGGTYRPSRLPGYPVPEMIFTLGWKLDSHLPVLMTALASAIMAGFFALILRAHGGRNVLLGCLALAFSPVIFIASTSSMDYIWALMFLLGSLWMIMRERSVPAGILLGLGIGCRLSTAVMILPLGILWLAQAMEQAGAAENRRVGHGIRKVAGPLAVWLTVSLLVGAACYLPVYRIFGWEFLDFFDTTRSWPLILFKLTIGSLGLIGLLGLGVALIWRPRMFRRLAPGQAQNPDQGKSELVGTGWHQIAWALAVALAIGLFFRLPLESGYLIPALPFALLLLGSVRPRAAFRFACYALVIAPFLFTIMPWPDARSRGPMPLMEGELGGRGVSLTLAGPLPADIWRRHWDIAKAQSILAAADQIREPSVLAVGFDLPIVQVVNQGLVRRGSVELVSFIGAEELSGYRQQDLKLFYVPGVEDWNPGRTGLDLRAIGAIPLSF